VINIQIIGKYYIIVWLPSNINIVIVINIQIIGKYYIIVWLPSNINIVINIQIIGKYYLIDWIPSNINIDVNLLTKGSDLLTYQENITIFKHAFKYIKDSKRFTIV
jgi:hypothetical protein